MHTGEVKKNSKIIDPRLIGLDRARERRDLCQKRGGQIKLQTVNGKKLKTCRHERPNDVHVYAEVPFGLYLSFTTLDDEFFSLSEKTQLLDFGRY